MTEEEWLECETPDVLLHAVELKVTDRKLRWFTSACCRRCWECILAAPSRRIIEALEKVADGEAVGDELEVIAQAARGYAESSEGRFSESGCSAAFMAVNTIEDYAGERFIHAASRVMHSAATTCYWRARETRTSSGVLCVTKEDSEGEKALRYEESFQVALLRDIFGNPFRPAAFSPSWRTDTVVALAAQMYETRNFDAMPVLADALQDAGCDNDEILVHCRGPGPHVRGCWVVDLVLGKE